MGKWGSGAATHPTARLAAQSHAHRSTTTTHPQKLGKVITRRQNNWDKSNGTNTNN